MLKINNIISKWPVFLTALLCMLIGANAYAAHDAAEELLFSYINEARLNPTAAITELGMNPGEVIEKNPDIENILLNGISVVNKYSLLDGSAGEHALDMIQKGYYATDSKDGTTPDERIVAAGYNPEITGETLGMLSFINYLTPANAAKHIFQNMLRDELSSSFSGQRNILNPDMEDVGIAVVSGKMPISGKMSNVYLAVCDFGKEEVSEPSFDTAGALVNLINQARKFPSDVIRSMQSLPAELIDEVDDYADDIGEKEAPVVLSAQLSQVLTSYVDNLISKAGTDLIQQQLDEEALSKRLISAGLTGEIVNVSKVIYFSDKPIAPEMFSQRLFNTLFTLEMFSGQLDDGLTLNPIAKEIGVDIRYVDIGVGDTVRKGYLANFLTVKSIANYDGLPLMGVVYIDKDENGLYSPGEGIENVSVAIDKWEYPQTYQIVDTIDSGSNGEIAFHGPSGLYRITFSTGNEEVMDIFWLRSPGKLIMWEVIPPGI